MPEEPPKCLELELVKSPHSCGGGQPLKLDVKCFKAILKRITLGETHPNACAAEGVTYRLFRMRVQQRPHWRKALELANRMRHDYRREQALGIVYDAGREDPKYAALFMDRDGWPATGPLNGRMGPVDLSPEAKEHLAELARAITKAAMEQAMNEPPSPPPPANVIELEATGS